MNAKAGALWVGPLAFILSFVVFVANGRAIGSGDTNAMEKTAASLATHGSFVMADDGAQDPFTRPVAGGRISIYPALPALIAAPFFFAFGLFVDLNLHGIQIAGKFTAALFAAFATGLLAHSFSRRVSPTAALMSALLFGIGTSVYSTAQALWQHPAVLVFLVVALSALERAAVLHGQEAFRLQIVAALSLSLAAASRPAVIPMCAVLFLFLIHQARTHAVALMGVACLPVAAVAVYNLSFFGAPWRFGPGLEGRFFSALPDSVLGLLISPARGLFVFTPIAALALWTLWRQARGRVLARGLIAAVLTHIAFMATWNEWHGGESFGPRLLTDMLPVLFFFVPEAVSHFPKCAAVFGTLSIAIQLLGGWTYDYRWERLYQRGGNFDAALWSWRDSPVAFAAREGVVTQGLPALEGRRLRVPTHRFVPFGRNGSLIEAVPGGLRIGGEALMRDIRLERGGRLRGGWIALPHPSDALAFRSVTGGAWTLRVVGSAGGSVGGSLSNLALGEDTVTVETAHGRDSIAVTGDFDVTLRFDASPGGDVFLRTQSDAVRLARIQIGQALVKP